MENTAKHVEAHLNKPFVIALPSKRLSGMVWEAQRPSGVELLKSEYARRKGGSYGSSGIEKFSFCSHKYGDFEIVFALKRPQSDNIAREERYHVHVNGVDQG